MTDRIELDPAAPTTLERSTANPWAIVAVVLLLAGVLVTAVSSTITAHNSTETCRSVSDGAFLGDPDPCW